MLNEFDIIQYVQKKFPKGKGVICGIGDDCAVLKAASQSQEQLFAIDTLVEGVHFARNCSLDAVGRKALAVNISDIAAMGGVTRSALVSVAIPRGFTQKKCVDLIEGLSKLARQYKISVIGGDTVLSKGPLVITVAVSGWVAKGKAIYRGGAKAGDAILCTGFLGGSLRGHHLKFKPRQDEAQWLMRHARIHAMIDISDGLVGDLGHILRQSGCGAKLYAAQLPLSNSMQRKNISYVQKIKQALYDGEDYELLFCVPQNEAASLVLKGQRKGIKLSAIGTITSKKNHVVLIHSSTKTEVLPVRGFQHRF